MPVFTANIPAALKVGDRIEIGGKIKENARKMSVNLCAQEGEEPRDVVLHFDVRFHRDNIISLSRKNGVWIGSGNYDTNYNMFVPGTIFRIVFEIKDTDVVTIYCQGKFHSNFLPKIPLGMAKYLVAWADVERITHCYFHLGSKASSGDELSVPQPPRQVVAPLIAEDPKTRARIRKQKSPASPLLRSSASSEDEKPRPKTNGRADRYIYDALMCHQNPLKGNRRRSQDRRVCGASDEDHSKECSETVSKSLEESSAVESEDASKIERIKRRGKFAPFMTFMGRGAATTRRN